MRGRGVRSRRGVRGRGVRGRGVRGHGVRAAGDRTCQRRACQRRAWCSAAAAVWAVRSAPHRWSARLMLVLRAVKERGMWLSGCVLGEEDVAGACALPCRAGETHSSMHAQNAGSSRVRSAAGGGRQAHRDLALGMPPSRYDLGGMDTARQSSTSGESVLDA